ncbi:hypothetical protein [Escherichia coli]|uniref:hypothetical protein n=1 Tax=Escherichia coli TaxID=562 RepID=UPI003D34D421
MEEIWGVGRRISKKLNTMGITTALQLARATPVFIRKNFNVVLERTVRGTHRRKLYFTGGSTAPQTADSLQQELWGTCHNL